MKFEEILLALKEGKKVRRIAWNNICIYCLYHIPNKQRELYYDYIDKTLVDEFRPFNRVMLLADDFFADDWEILTSESTQSHPQ